METTVVVPALAKIYVEATQSLNQRGCDYVNAHAAEERSNIANRIFRENERGFIETTYSARWQVVGQGWHYEAGDGHKSKTEAMRAARISIRQHSERIRRDAKNP